MRYQWKGRISKLKSYLLLTFLSGGISWPRIQEANFQWEPSFGAFIDPSPWPVILVLIPCLALRRLWPSWPRTKAHSPPHRASSIPKLDEVISCLHTLEIASPLRSLRPPPPRMNLKVPRFDGIDAMSWIFKISQFFYYHGTPNDEQLQVASFYLDGPTFSWFQWMFRND